MSSSSHVCRECGAEFAKWAGRCTACAAWNSIEEFRPPPAGRESVDRQRTAVSRLADVAGDDGAATPTGIAELDRVLDGGLVAGSVTLLGGEPGIGKSTLALQVAANWPGTCCYLSGEESPQQVRRRAARLNPSSDDVLVAGETSLQGAIATLNDVAPSLLIVDSIQTIADERVAGAPGSPTQVRDCTQQLVAEAKARGVAVILVGHVTKSGALAGPRALEHVVDTVLTFEGDRHHAMRLLRAIKHRFGSTDELGLFEMTGTGLVAVADPSQLFLTDRRRGVAGSLIVPTLDGRRPLLVEVQALTVEIANGASGRRTTQGFDSSRLAMLLAVIERRVDVPANRHDVYVATVGGVRLGEPGGDLAVALAVMSTIDDVPAAADVVAIGEIGLGGEVRRVDRVERRLAEAARLGYRRALVPVGAPAVDGVDTIEVETLAAAREVLYSRLSVATARWGRSQAPPELAASDVAVGGVRNGARHRLSG